jgi:uncharacterized phage protein (TIGR01671 family)
MRRYKMREIKFRGKRIDTGEWVFGYFSMNDENGKCYITNQTKAGGAHPWQVIPETVGQYTGLKDKNGTNEDIYEKDIMEFHAYGIHYIGVVEYHGSAFGIICRNTEVKASPFLDDAIDRHGAIKIGNIHDNPELIHDQKAEVEHD